MSQHRERAFEDALCEHLAAHGWAYSPNAAGYDRERALWSEDVIGWLEDTQPEELAKVSTSSTTVGSASTTVGSASTTGGSGSIDLSAVLDRLVKVLDTPLTSGGGTLSVLRNGFKVTAGTTARFSMCQFRPETSYNETAKERYAKVRLRVARQVFFSEDDPRSVDLVLFVNGLPVATIELKTDFTQGVGDAIAQYKTTRLPKDPRTNRRQPLFVAGHRALVHFAVSNDEVWMTTELAGDKTHFLPFNTGADGGAGNPLNPHGSRTAYLWERVLQRDAWLDVLGRFLHTETTTTRDPISGRVDRSTRLLFPRFHQWEAVTGLTESARAEGPGGKYLVQHSAGSGKTNSIAWTAHRLARLHDEQDHKVFDSVVVVTDRTVLDDQLQEAIRQIDGDNDVVGAVDDASIRAAGVASKSALLTKYLTERRLIIVVTIQTFATDGLAAMAGLGDRSFAVIADEAHSSQTGNTAKRLRAVLSAEEVAEVDDGGEYDVEAVLAADATARANADNISYFAFTATPKAKTLELFGRRPAPGEPPAPFHVYSMRQAIEEEYILDVLPGYQTYKTAFRIAQEAAAGMREVDEAAATRGLMRWVRLHPTNISQKVQIVVEHFRENVAGLLDAHAKAMVVTDSRKAAVRWKTAIDDYIKNQGYGIGTLVAFSGTVDDLQTSPEPLTESSMNPGAGDLRAAFERDDFRIMLVANKFQTGFDQPLLCAMYVDKRLSGVTAVQTLSRLNRVYRTPSGVRKSRPTVLDFVNDPEEVRASFEPYYTDAFLETETDPDLVHDLATKLDQAAIFGQADLDRAAEVMVKRLGHESLSSAVGPAELEFHTREANARISEDRAALDVLEQFRKDVSTFVRLYDFMSQVIDYGDVGLEKRAIFLRLLERRIAAQETNPELEISDVDLVTIRQVDTGVHDLGLGEERVGLEGMTAAGSGGVRDPKMVAFAEVVARLNDLFGDEFTAAQKEAFASGVVTTLRESDVLATQAAANSATQFLESPDLKDEVLATVGDNQGAQSKMADYFFSDDIGVDRLVRAIGAAFYASVREAVP